jgi:ubiquinone/menaquinone biosynthesis C-methylase UbiE
MKGSYQFNSFAENKEIEINRLKAQVELFFDKEFEVYKKFGLADGMHIIECGSGPGYLMRNILKQFKNCKATALEIDSYLFEVLSENSVSNGEKIYDPIQGSIYDIDLPDNSIDFAVTRLVVEHLHTPYKAFSELYRILKPNGILVVVSNDFSYHVLTYPVIPELDDMFAAHNASSFKEGGNPLVGRQLPVFFQHSGFKKIAIEIATAHSQLNGDQAMLSAENVNISRTLVKNGFLNEKTLENLVANWYDMLKAPDHIIYRQLFIVGGIKDESLDVDFQYLQEKYVENLKILNEQQINSEQQDEKDIHVDIKDFESILLKEWRRALDSESVTISDNFFDIGGHSLLIPDIIRSMLHRTGIKLKILEFFKYSTVKSLTEHIVANLSNVQNNPDKGGGEVLTSKESIRKTSRGNKYASNEEQKEKLKAQRNKFKNSRKK